VTSTPEVIESTCRCVGSYGAWIVQQRDMMFPIVAFCLKSLAIPSVGPFASQALAVFSSRATERLAAHEGFFPSLVQAVRLGLSTAIPLADTPSSRLYWDALGEAVSCGARVASQSGAELAPARCMLLLEVLLPGLSSASLSGPLVARVMRLLEGLVRFAEFDTSSGGSGGVLLGVRLWPDLLKCASSEHRARDEAVQGALCDWLAMMMHKIRPHQAPPELGDMLDTALRIFESSSLPSSLAPLMQVVESLGPSAGEDILAALATKLDRVLRVAKAWPSAPPPETLQAVMDCLRAYVLFTPKAAALSAGVGEGMAMALQLVSSQKHLGVLGGAIAFLRSFGTSKSLVEDDLSASVLGRLVNERLEGIVTTLVHLCCSTLPSPLTTAVAFCTRDLCRSLNRPDALARAVTTVSLGKAGGGLSASHLEAVAARLWSLRDNADTYCSLFSVFCGVCRGSQPMGELTTEMCRDSG
jgi:hypothetical protein